MKKISIIFYCLLLVIVFFITTAGAHNLWMTASNYSPKVGESVEINIGWGHKFPKDESIKEGMLEQIYAINPEGNRVFLKKSSLNQYVLTPKLKGAYIVVSNINPVFFSKTTEGRKKGTKKDLEKVVKCTHYNIGAKTVIIAGNKDRGFSSQANSLLEIIPLKRTEQLEIGDIFPFKVLFRGKPLPGIYVEATYDGFLPAETSIDHKPLKVSFVHKTMLDKKGEAAIKLIEKGIWMVKADCKIPYEDEKECDDDFYITILTFEIK